MNTLNFKSVSKAFDTVASALEFFERPFYIELALPDV